MATDTPFRLLLTGQDKIKRDITGLVRSLRWSGSAGTVTREVSGSILQDEADRHLPQVPIELGAAVELQVAGEPVFGGILTERSRDSSAYELDFTARDWGYYLKLNEDYLKVDRQTPEAVAAQICAQTGLTVGALAQTGVMLSHNFLPDNYYSMIQTLYELAGAQTGKRYAIQFKGTAMYVKEIRQDTQSILLRPGSNLIRCVSKEALGELKNRVKIYNDNDVIDSTIEDSESQALYGVFQTAILKSSYDDASAQARQILEQNKVSTQLSMQCTGNARLISGNTVVVYEPITGSYGLMWIKSDAHTWAKGVYQTRLGVSMEALVDEEAAGKAAGNAGEGIA